MLDVAQEPVQQYGNRSHQAECVPLGKYPAYGSDIEQDDEGKGLGFSSASIRRGFIRKVYLILLAQLITSLVVIVALTVDRQVRLMVADSTWMFLVAILIVVFSLVALSCNEDLRRQTPANLLFLAAFTIAESFLLGVVACRYAPMEIFMSVLITASVCLGLSLFALQTRYDFTVLGGILVSCLIILLLFGTVSLLVGGHMVTTIYASLSALLFSIYLVHDTQLMMGGKHRYSISPEEYIFAALNIYMDVMNIFLEILQLLGGSD
ncbi:protein lifeguard 1 [Drosophila erecta]|uniref:GG21447 n=1 Tax=Drosophila erecta TaxID=7220 RepID=B3P0M5_DROER|nr:protein lifeguard 1 [Drosophila erecta]EDV48851.1 uncharacterized protein Dere_GG21447 [Drosophila erecta]